jgi:hypothetical protein
MEKSRKRRHRTRPALVALIAAATLFALCAQAASAAPAATQRATSKCWLAVINDWLDNNRVDKTYPVACYTQAIQHLSSYPDISQYSTAIDDIHRALLIALHQDRGGGPGSFTGSSGGPSSNGPGSSSTLGATKQTKSHNRGIISRISKDLGPGNAQSIPLPLLVLGGFAVLLLLTALVTWLLRRMQARRGNGTPAPARATSSVRPES